MAAQRSCPLVGAAEVWLHAFLLCVLPWVEGALRKAERPPEGEKGDKKPESSGMT